MPRKARRESSTDMYHIIIRGNNKNWIFRKEAHKTKIRSLLLHQEDLHLMDIYAWCIMDNHIHLVIKAKKEKMFEAMWNINRLFARHYNYKEKSVGHVFENRYKSEAIETDQYLKQVIRYVHNNPVKAKIVKEANEYKWSSYKNYLEGGYRTRDIDILKAYFNSDVIQFIEYHNEVDEEEYMEIKEDLIANREEKAQRIINYYCEKYGITSVFEMNKQEQLRQKIIQEIIIKSKLPLRRIGEITGLSYSSIQEIYMNLKQKEY